MRGPVCLSSPVPGKCCRLLYAAIFQMTMQMTTLDGLSSYTRQC